MFLCTHQESSSHRSDAAGEEGRGSGATPHDVGIIIYLNDLDGDSFPTPDGGCFFGGMERNLTLSPHSDESMLILLLTC